ncbi:MAG: hypothetical protein KDD55_05755 [Bdellovibrionales bacterium]|nr:hypothetical protein [Bdellovibrionales bacterium]
MFRLATLVFAFIFLVPSHGNAQSYFAIGDGTYCIQFPDASQSLGQYTGGGNIDLIDFQEKSNQIARKATRLRKKLQAVKNFIKTNGGNKKPLLTFVKKVPENIQKAKKLAAKFKAQLKQIEFTLELIQDCEDQQIDFTGAGNIAMHFVYPAPFDFSDRNYNVAYLPLLVERNRKGKVKTNLKFCISYIKRDDSSSFKLAPFEYIATFNNDPCAAGRLPGSSCPNFFGDKNLFGHILTVLNGIGDEPSTSWQAEKLSDIIVTSRPMGKLGCLGDNGFRK